MRNLPKRLNSITFRSIIIKFKKVKRALLQKSPQHRHDYVILPCNPCNFNFKQDLYSGQSKIIHSLALFCAPVILYLNLQQCNKHSNFLLPVTRLFPFFFFFCQICLIGLLTVHDRLKMYWTRGLKKSLL